MLFNAISNKVNHGEFEAVLKELTDDMAIYSTDQNETFTLVNSG